MFCRLIQTNPNSIGKKPDVKRFLKHILESCNLSTEKVEKLKIKRVSTSAKFHTDRNVYSRPDGSFYEEYEVYRTEVQKARQDKTLKWDLCRNCSNAFIKLIKSWTIFHLVKFFYFLRRTIFLQRTLIRREETKDEKKKGKGKR